MRRQVIKGKTYLAEHQNIVGYVQCKQRLCRVFFPSKAVIAQYLWLLDYSVWGGKKSSGHLCTKRYILISWIASLLLYTRVPSWVHHLGQLLHSHLPVSQMNIIATYPQDTQLIHTNVLLPAQYLFCYCKRDDIKFTVLGDNLCN